MEDRSRKLTIINTGTRKTTAEPVKETTTKVVKAPGAGSPIDLSAYLLKSVWEKVFEFRKDSKGTEYLFGKLPLVLQYGLTMYADNGVEIPTLAEGLPFDQRTIWFNPETGQIEVIGGTGGSEGGVSNFWELNNIPSWITQAKPTYQYSEIKNTPDLSVYATTSLLNQTLASYVTNNALANTLLSYPTFTDLQDELKGYVNVDYKQDVVGIKNFVNGLQIGELPITKLQDDVIYIDANLVVRGGVTMFYENGELDLPTIIDEIGIAGYDGKKLGLVSFSSSQFSIDANGNVTIKGGSTGLDTAQLAEYLTSNKYATQSWVTSQGYASSSSLSALQNEVHDFLEGSDADNIINKWRELESFLSGLRESDNLSDILATKANQSALDATNATVATKWTQDNNKITQWNTAYGWGDHSKVGYALNSALQALSNVVDTKWTQDNVKISNWDTAYSWGNHASVGYALKSYVDKTFVTIGGNEDVTGVHNFVNGLKIGNVKISKIQDGAIYVEGDLVVKGGVTMYSDSNADFDSIYDGLPIDGTTIYWDNGVLKAKHIEGALTDITSEMVIAALGYTPYNASNPSGYITISALNGYATQAWVEGKNYLTSHQSLDGYINEISTTGSGNAVTSVSKSGKKITFTKGATFLTEHQDLSGYQTKITSSNKLAYSLISGTPTSLKNPTSLKFGSKTYDGSNEQTILASDLGAITSHQTIYTLTFQSGIFSAGNFTANSAKQTINVPTTTSHISEGSNLYFTNARAISALKSTTDSLASDIATKWTQNDTKINNWDTAFGWGDHSKNDYTTNKYVDDTFVTLKTEQTITGKKNFTTGGLFVNGKQIHYDATNKYWKLEGDLLVTGGVTMYGDDGSDLPSIFDSLPIASTSALGIASFDSNYFSVDSNGKVTFIGQTGTSNVSILSDLMDVSPSVSGTADVNRILYQEAGSSTWITKPLSEIGGGGSVSGAVRYLSTLGSSSSWYDNTYRLYGEWGLHDRLYLKTEGGYDVVASLAEKDGNGNVIASTYLPLSGGTLTGNLTLGNSSNTSHIGYYINRSGNTIGLAPDYNCACLRFATSTSYTNYLRLANGALDLSYDGGTNWNNILHAGNISSYNAGSATKLQTARTIWGQSFDGTGNVGGNIYMDNNVSLLWKQTDGNYVIGVQLSASNNLTIGTQTAQKGYETYISGKNIYLRYGTSPTIGLIINENGKVGIGTTSPTQPLHVVGNIATYVPSTSDPTASIDLANTVNDRWQISGRFNKNSAANNNKLNIYYYNGSKWDTKMTLQTNGNVGIGTESPAYKLDVNGTIRFASKTIWGQSFDGTGNIDGDLYLKNEKYIKVYDASGNSHTAFHMSGGNNLHIGHDTAVNGYNTYISGKTIYLQTYGNAFNIAMSINSNGYVGIGTSSPSYKLHVDGDIRTSTTLYAGSKVAIGTTSPSCNLHVNGNAFIRHTAAGVLRLERAAAYGVYIDYFPANQASYGWRVGATEGKSFQFQYTPDAFSNVSTLMTISNGGNLLVSGGITMYSQRSLKNVIHQNGLSLEQLSAIKPTMFTWKDGRDNRIHYGGIAEEVEHVLPEVIYKSSDNILTMDYGNAGFVIASSLIKPVVSHEERIKRLEEENNELKKELEYVRRELENN